MSEPTNKPPAIDPGPPDDGAYVHIPGDTRQMSLPPDVASRRDQIFPRLRPAEIDRLRRYGTVKTWQPGELLFEAGKPSPGMLVLLAGRIMLIRRDGMGVETPLLEYIPGEFLGEVSHLVGGPALADGRAIGVVEALLIAPASLRAAVVIEAELGERIMRALILRRVVLIETGTGGPVLIDAPGTEGMVRLLGFLSRNAQPYLALDPASDRAAAEVVKRHAPRPDELPLVACPDGSVLKCPSEQELARRIGLLPELHADRVYDVAIVGAGPAGLAAAVYAASEGLSVVVLESYVIGGQAGASARIENYFGFPTGISGPALVGRAFVQSLKFGAEVAVPIAVTRLDCAGPLRHLDLDSGVRLSSRSAIIATGAKYRRPDIPDLARYEGRGVYYWASPIEAQLCWREEIVLVGGGNSAGQAVVFLASHAAHVHVLLRGPDLARSMSSYLVQRIAALGNVTVHPETVVVALEGGDEGLTGLRWRNRRDGTEATKAVKRLFLFVGADPNTGWLAGSGVTLDAKGFIRTGSDPSADEGARSWPKRERQPSPNETLVPGVFAIGDARAGSTKRVASAVGEGASVIAQVHAWLAADAK